MLKTCMLSGKIQGERLNSFKRLIFNEKNWCFGKDATVSRRLANFCWVRL